MTALFTAVFPKNGIDPGYTISSRNLGTFIAYNTNLVPAQVVAKTKTFEDWVKLAEQKEYQRPLWFSGPGNRRRN